MPYRANGSATIHTTVPDTITSWIATAFATNTKTGLGITPSSSKVSPFVISAGRRGDGGGDVVLADSANGFIVSRLAYIMFIFCLVCVCVRTRVCVCVCACVCVCVCVCV